MATFLEKNGKQYIAFCGENFQILKIEGNKIHSIDAKERKVWFYKHGEILKQTYQEEI